MRSTAAGLIALVVFAVLQSAAKFLFPETLAAHGTGRDILSFLVLGPTLATFFAVYFLYGRRRRSRRRPKRR